MDFSSPFNNSLDAYCESIVNKPIDSSIFTKENLPDLQDMSPSFSEQKMYKSKNNQIDKHESNFIQNWSKKDISSFHSMNTNTGDFINSEMFDNESLNYQKYYLFF